MCTIFVVVVSFAESGPPAPTIGFRTWHSWHPALGSARDRASPPRSTLRDRSVHWSPTPT